MNATFQETRSRPTQPSYAPAVGAKIPAVVHEVLRSPGQPLDPVTRAFMEPRFAHNFGRVRVHNDTKSADSARAVNAQAYTVGQQIVFGANQFAPMSYQGRQLLAHELAHTIQQQSLAADSPVVHSSEISESSASAAARTVGKGQAISSHLPTGAIRLARQPTDVSEDAERERLAADAEAAIARYEELERKWEKEKTEEDQRESSGQRSRERTLFPPISSALEGMPLVSDEEIPDEKKRREMEEKAKKARIEQELKESHDRLLVLRGTLLGDSSGAIRYQYSVKTIMALINKGPLDRQLLRRYGLELPGRNTKRKAFYSEVIDAVSKFDAAWRKTYGTGSSPVVSDLPEEKVKAMEAEQERREGEAAKVEGLEPVEGSLAGAVGAEVTSWFTSDPKKITAGAKMGTAISGVVASIAAAKGKQGTYSPQVEGPGPFANPVGAWRYSGRAPTTSALAPPVAEPVPTTEPQKTAAPTQGITPSGGGAGGAAGGGPSTRQTIVANPPPMPARPPSGPTPVTDVQVVTANIFNPSSIKPAVSQDHQNTWQQLSGSSASAPPAFRDQYGNIHIRNDHWLVAPATRCGNSTGATWRRAAASNATCESPDPSASRSGYRVS